MTALARLPLLLLPLLLLACTPDEPLRGNFQCVDQSQFRYNRQAQTVELIRDGSSFHGFMDEKRQMVWPKHENDRSLPDTYALSRKIAGQLTLYGGFAGKGLACRAATAQTAP